MANAFAPRERKRVQQSFEGPSLTQKHQAGQADINNIVGRHLAAGGTMRNLGDPRATREPMFGDFTHAAMGYHQALNMVMGVQERFERLPATLRSKFFNDPQKLLAWLEDPKNLKEAQALRLLPDPDFEDPFVEDLPRSSGGGQGGASATPPAPPPPGPSSSPGGSQTPA